MRRRNGMDRRIKSDDDGEKRELRLTDGSTMTNERLELRLTNGPTMTNVREGRTIQSQCKAAREPASPHGGGGFPDVNAKACLQPSTYCSTASHTVMVPIEAVVATRIAEADSATARSYRRAKI